MLDKSILQDLLKRAADTELEKQFYENGNGFLSKPYENYRFHNGFISGAVWMFKALDQLEKQRNEQLYNAHLYFKIKGTDLCINKMNEEIYEILKK